MSARVRIGLLVGALAAGAAIATIAVTLVQGDDPEEPCGGRPPRLFLDLGVRDDAAARALRRGAALYADDRLSEALRVFQQYRSVDARVAAAFARWPDQTLATLRQLAADAPRSALVHLHLGLAHFCSGRTPQALAAWRAAGEVEPDSLSAIRADDLRHSDTPPGRPTFVPSFPPPARLIRLGPQAQLAALERAARRPQARPKLLYGRALQRLGRPLSAARQYAAAARLEPATPDPHVAAAVALFDKDAPARAFSRLGPLTRRFPRAATVRFHLALLLFWLGRIDEGKRQLVLARRVEPSSPLAREANRYLLRLETTRTKRPER